MSKEEKDKLLDYTEFLLSNKFALDLLNSDFNNTKAYRLSEAVVDLYQNNKIIQCATSSNQ